jgi:hypothetical protein
MQSNDMMYSGTQQMLFLTQGRSGACDDLSAFTYEGCLQVFANVLGFIGKWWRDLCQLKTLDTLLTSIYLATYQLADQCR